MRIIHDNLKNILSFSISEQIKWWSVLSLWLPLHPRQDWRSEDKIDISIIVAWYRVYLRTTICLGMFFVMDSLGWKSSNITPLVQIREAIPSHHSSKENCHCPHGCWGHPGEQLNPQIEFLLGQYQQISELMFGTEAQTTVKPPPAAWSSREATLLFTWRVSKQRHSDGSLWNPNTCPSPFSLGTSRVEKSPDPLQEFCSRTPLCVEMSPFLIEISQSHPFLLILLAGCGLTWRWPSVTLSCLAQLNPKAQEPGVRWWTFPPGLVAVSFFWERYFDKLDVLYGGFWITVNLISSPRPTWHRRHYKKYGVLIPLHHGKVVILQRGEDHWGQNWTSCFHLMTIDSMTTKKITLLYKKLKVSFTQTKRKEPNPPKSL